MKDIIFPFALITGFFISYDAETVKEYKIHKSETKNESNVVVSSTKNTDTICYRQIPNNKNPRLITNVAYIFPNELNNTK